MSNEDKVQQIETSGGSNFTNGSNKFKSYLIEKLLSESPSNYKSLPMNTEDKEDATSETGTYTIEDDLINNKKMLDLEIDEKFGINRPDVGEPAKISPRRQTKIIRVRNQTYSLSNEIADQSCTSSETSSSHSITKLTKTSTYNLITDANPDSARTIATNVLLGDTDNLIKEIKKQENMSSSSASSSSTNLSNENKTKCWTIPGSSSPTPNRKPILESLSTRATVDYDGQEDYVEETSTPKKSLAFEFSLTPENTFVSKNLIKKEPQVSSSRSEDSKATITKGFELRKNRRDMASSVNSSTSFNSPKSNAPSGISLGARIQEKAKENMSLEPKRRGSDTTAPQNLQYTNRTLYLRQQSAKAKRESLDKKPKEGILKKPAQSMSRNSSLSRSTLTPKTSNNTRPNSVKKSSRNVSPCDNSLMTGSLNLPNRSLPDSFQRRKMYDPAKSVQADKEKKIKELENKKALFNNSTNDFNDFDSMSESSYNSLPHQQVDTPNQVNFFFSLA